MSYAYVNSNDTIRFKIWNRKSEGGVGWDVDFFFLNSNEMPDVRFSEQARASFRMEPDMNVWITTYSQETGDVFRTKADASNWVKKFYGKVRQRSYQDMLEGWVG